MRISADLDAETGVYTMTLDVKTLDINNHLQAKEDVRNQLPPGLPCVVDLSRVEFVDSSGLTVFVSLVNQAKETQTPIALAEPAAAVSRLFTLVDLQDWLPIFDSRTEAITHLQQGAA